MSVVPALRFPALLAACLLLLAGSALAASPLVEIKDLKQPLAAGSPTTYADLLKLIFPEKPAGQEEQPETPPVRSLSDYFKAQPLTAKKQEYGGVEALTIKDHGRPLLLLLVAATGERAGEEGDAEEQPYNLLALFQTAPTPKLLDLVDIGQGMSMGMGEGFWTKNPLLELTPATQACMVYQEHFNSSQGYLQIHLLWVRNQRLEELLGVSPFGQKAFVKPSPPGRYSGPSRIKAGSTPKWWPS